MDILDLIFNLLYFASFLSGTLFGIVIAAIGLLHFLSSKPTYLQEVRDEKDRLVANRYEDDLIQELPDEERTNLNKIIDYLDEVNSPLKTMGGVLQRIHLNKEQDAIILETKMKTIIDYNSLVKMERDFLENISELKDHAKQLKQINNFLSEMGKTFNSISKDLSKLAYTARNNMNKNSNLEKKEDLIVNNWWQTLQVALDHMASDQEDFATIITEELMNYSSQIQEEITIIEKRLLSEGNKQFSLIKENISLFESRLKEREKIKEKIRSTTVSSSASDKERDQSKRAIKFKQSEENLVQQTKKLYDVQKEFYSLFPRISSDVQLTVLKSIVETQSQLFKLTDGFERTQHHSQSISRRMKAQLTNAAASLVQMLREESKLVEDPSSIAIEVMRQKMTESGVQGYELSLQKVLEGLLVHGSIKEIGDSSPLPPTSPYSAAAPISALTPEEAGKLNMFAESSACLSATNPALLPSLPRSFQTSIGYETCVWFNAFMGRVYRDMSCSKYFYEWFCSKLTTLLNKNEKERPAFVDAFQVVGVEFGELPPLLMNVKWSPPLGRKAGRDEERGETGGVGGGKKKGKSERKEKKEVSMEEVEGRTRDSPETEEEYLYYGACTADMAFRSGIKFTIATQLFLNWPRDKYMSVPVLIHLSLSELSGRVRFGCTRSYSFLSFLKDPMMRISVRSEVGNDKYKLKDIPQVSDFIVKKLKSFIHQKIVYPRSHKFRLIWPRTWWPEGTENLFTPTGPSGTAPLPTDPPLSDKRKEGKKPRPSVVTTPAPAIEEGGELRYEDFRSLSPKAGAGKEREGEGKSAEKKQREHEVQGRERRETEEIWREVLRAGWGERERKEAEERERSRSLPPPPSSPRLKRGVSVGDFRSASLHLLLGDLGERVEGEEEVYPLLVADDGSPLPPSQGVKKVSSREGRGGTASAAESRVRGRSGTDGGEEGRGSLTRKEEMKLLLLRGKEKMERAKERAKAKFSELKLKMFHEGGEGGGGEGGESKGEGGKVSKGLGEKINTFLFADEEASPEGAKKAGRGSYSGATGTGGGKEGGDGAEASSGGSTAMKYVASIFRSGGGGETGEGKRLSIRRGSKGVDGVGTGSSAGESRMKDIFSKAFSSRRHEREKDT